jgi:putative ABC transport system permease protein
MRAVWRYLRNDLRRRPSAWLALALIVGVGAGASLTALAGARRAASAYPRFLVTHDASDVSTGGIEEGLDIGKALDVIERLPQVAEASRLRIVAGKAVIHGRAYSLPDFFAFASVTGTLPERQDRPKVLKGTLPTAGSSDEAILPFQTAERFGLKVGDVITVVLGDPFSAGGKEAPVRVVGIAAIPGLFQGVSGSAPGGVVVASGFIERYRDDVIPADSGDFYFSQIRFHHGAADIPAFEASLAQTPYKNIDLQFTAVHLADVQKAMRPYSVALWLLGGVGMFIVLIIAGQLLARQIAVTSTDYPALRALGFGRGQLVRLGIARAAAVALIAAPIAILTAYLLSPLTPIGDARVAEPSPGLAFDVLVFVLGAAGVILVACALSVVPSWRAARSATARSANTGFERPSIAAAAAAGAAASAPAVTGLRMAFEPGRGRSAVPVRAAILSVAVAVAVLCSTAVFSASLHRLIETPSLSGLTYDALVIAQVDDDAKARPITRRVVEGSPFIQTFTSGNIGDAEIGGRNVFVFALAPHGGIGFSSISGRVPADSLHDGLPEIAVGPATLRRAHWHVGQTVSFPLDVDNALKPVRALIVGTAAMPALPFRQDEPGDGIVMTLTSYHVLAPDPIPEPPCCFVTFKKGIDPQDARAKLQAEGMQVFLRSSRADLAALSKVAGMPTTLAYIIGAAAAIVIAYALLTAIARRRRDLAILKVIGFVRGQVRRAVAWQASALTVVSVAIAIPIGIILGRYGWRLFADQFGVVPDPAVPLYLIVTLIPFALVLANLIAIIPAGAAARTKPALVLREE